GTLVCYAKQEAKTCADYGYVASCPTGQTGTAHSVKLGSTTSTCYSDCKASYFEYTVVTLTNSNNLYVKCYESSTSTDSQNIGSLTISFSGTPNPNCTSCHCPSKDATIQCGKDGTYIINLSDVNAKNCYNWSDIDSVSCDDGKQVANSSGDIITCNGKKIKFWF
ncbi:MAG: hypothetical protein J6J35_03585, partial [Alphaproteobacteria bacterium]|nr:hypothetical protein [Alphaproteobacteria bacterium]